MTTQTEVQVSEFPVHYGTTKIDNLDVLYRDAGPKDAPVILLLHGFPTSSNMFRNLIPRLSQSFRVIAPDYPGFGMSSMPDHKEFAYTFENLMNVVDGLIDHLGLKKYSMYVMDYGAPIGYRLALPHPERVQAFIIQNGNTNDERRLASRDPTKKSCNQPSQQNGQA